MTSQRTAAGSNPVSRFRKIQVPSLKNCPVNTDLYVHICAFNTASVSFTYLLSGLQYRECDNDNGK